MEKRRQFGFYQMGLHGELPPKKTGGHSAYRRWEKAWEGLIYDLRMSIYEGQLLLEQESKVKLFPMEALFQNYLTAAFVFNTYL
jgi:hypothetical protein